MPRIVSLSLIALAIVGLGAMFFQVVTPFLLPLFLAGVLAILSQPLFQRILPRCRGKAHLAAALTTVTILALCLVPIALGTLLAARQLYSLTQTSLQGDQLRTTISNIHEQLQVEQLARRLEDLTGVELPRADVAEFERQIPDRLRQMAGTVVQKTLGFAGSTLGMLGSLIGTLVGVLMFIVAFYYFLADGPSLVTHTQQLIPVDRVYQGQLVMQFTQAVRAVVLATLAAAFAQGLATACGLYVLGFRHFFLFTAIATFTALIPMLGTWLVWFPCAAWLAWTGQWMQAAILTLYGTAVIGVLDNVIRTYILQSNVKLHPLLAFVSVLGGLEVLGLWGVFVGPIIASCLYALVKIFNTELAALSRERLTLQGATGAGGLPIGTDGEVLTPGTAPAPLPDGQPASTSATPPTAAVSPAPETPQ